MGQSRRQTAMHNLVRNRWDAVYWNIHYNFSPFFSLFSPIATPEAKRGWPRRLPTRRQGGNLWFTISTGDHPRLRFGLRRIFRHWERSFFRVVMDTFSPPTDVDIVKISFRFSRYFRYIVIVYVAWNFTLSAMHIYFTLINVITSIVKPWKI